MKNKILIVDDENNIRRTLRLVLESEGYEVRDASNLGAARAILKEDLGWDAVLLDVKLTDGSGIDLLQEIKSNPSSRNIQVVMISGHASISDAVRATQLTAFDFLEKPLGRDKVLITVRNASDRSQTIREISRLRSEVGNRSVMLGTSVLMETLRKQISKVAPTNSRVLITGESGTGKELVAKAIHHNSSNSSGTFVKVNCAAISPQLIESELFGHEKGAFTGASSKKRGLFELASDGTIFLDEIGDMTLEAQAKVLRVLQTGEFVRVGGETTTLKTNARVLAATNKPLEEMISNGTFREDLYFRLNVFPIVTPKLSDRREDIPLLTEAFVQECCVEHGLGEKQIPQNVLDLLTGYDWPGNIRELRNIVERMVILSEADLVEADLPAEITKQSKTSAARDDLDFSKWKSLSLREFRESMEKQFVLHHLLENDWNISRTAKLLGVERTNLHKKIKSLGIVRQS